MKANVYTDARGVITGWVASPLDPSAPIYEIDDPSAIRIGYDRFEDGAVVPDDEAYAQAVEAKEKKDAELSALNHGD